MLIQPFPNYKKIGGYRLLKKADGMHFQKDIYVLIKRYICFTQKIYMFYSKDIYV